MANINVQFKYLLEQYNLSFESTIAVDKDGMLDDIQAGMLVSIVLSKIPTKRLCVQHLTIMVDEKIAYKKIDFCFSHIGETL